MTKILFLSANPSDTISLELYKEIYEIYHEVHHAKFGDTFEFEPKVAIRWRDISELLSSYKPDIVHFSGHGNESSELIFEDERGVSHPVPVKDIRTMFRALRGNIKCVVLNACYAEAQASEIADYIDCVVGISGQIDDTAAIGFSREFYRQLADGKDVLTAYQLGCTHVAQGQDLVKLITPRANSTQILFVHSKKRNNRLMQQSLGSSILATGIIIIVIAAVAIGYFYGERSSTGGRPTAPTLTEAAIDSSVMSIDGLPYTALAWDYSEVPEEKGNAYISLINVPGRSKAYKLDYSLPLTSTRYSGLGLAFSFTEAQDLSDYNRIEVKIHFESPTDRCHLDMRDISGKLSFVTLGISQTFNPDISVSSDDNTQTVKIPLDPYYSSINRNAIKDMGCSASTEFSQGEHSYTIYGIAFLK